MTQSSSCQPCTSRRPLSQPEAGVLIKISLHGPPKAIEQDDGILDSLVEPQPEIGGHFVACITDKDNAAKAPMLDHSLVQVRQAGPQHSRSNILDRDLECQRELDKLCRESVDVLICVICPLIRRPRQPLTQKDLAAVKNMIAPLFDWML